MIKLVEVNTPAADEIFARQDKVVRLLSAAQIDWIGRDPVCLHQGDRHMRVVIIEQRCAAAYA